MNDLKAQLEAARKAAAETIAKQMEEAKMKAELALLTNPAFTAAKARQAMREEVTTQLESWTAQCRAIVEDNPINSVTLRQVRKFNPSKRYGLGNQMAELTGLLSGIQYSAAEHSETMRAVVGIGKDLIESTLEALGSLPYYSANYDEVVEGTVGNAEALLDCVHLIELATGLNIDTSQITQAKLQQQHNTAYVKAERAKAEADQAEALQQFVMSV